jgi:pimeloyl-ACP methyl ester carboxylesterase
MIQFLGRGVAGFALLLVSYIAVGGLMSASGAPKPRGQMVEIEPGRKLRLVCEGPKSDRPVVWLEAGAFGFAADWGATQEALTAAGWRSCAYDRAGMGYSPPGPQPRDGLAIVSDFEKLVAASGEPGPYILVGHSMAGLRLREYAGRNPDKIAGLVLVDAATPEALAEPADAGLHQGLRLGLEVGGARRVDRALQAAGPHPAWATRSACRRPPRPRSAGPSPTVATTVSPPRRWSCGSRPPTRPPSSRSSIPPGRSPSSPPAR